MIRLVEYSYSKEYTKKISDKMQGVDTGKFTWDINGNEIDVAEYNGKFADFRLFFAANPPSIEVHYKCNCVPQFIKDIEASSTDEVFRIANSLIREFDKELTPELFDYLTQKLGCHFNVPMRRETIKKNMIKNLADQKKAASKR